MFRVPAEIGDEPRLSRDYARRRWRRSSPASPTTRSRTARSIACISASPGAAAAGMPSCRRRRAYQQSARRNGHEWRHPRRGQSRRASRPSWRGEGRRAISTATSAGAAASPSNTSTQTIQNKRNLEASDPAEQAEFSAGCARPPPIRGLPTTISFEASIDREPAPRGRARLRPGKGMAHPARPITQTDPASGPAVPGRGAVMRVGRHVALAAAAAGMAALPRPALADTLDIRKADKHDARCRRQLLDYAETQGGSTLDTRRVGCRPSASARHVALQARITLDLHRRWRAAWASLRTQLRLGAPACHRRTRAPPVTGSNER